MGRVSQVQGGHELTGVPPFAAAAMLLVCLLSAGCATYPTRTADHGIVPLQRAGGELPDAALLDVRIEVFAPGVLPTGADEARGLSDKIRKAEAHFIPVNLRNTLQQTGYWGAVRVVPEGTIGAEVLVTGRIVDSDGEVLEIEIAAQDATGKHWYTRTYKSVVQVSAYSGAASRHTDVFQNVYNQAANDLATYRSRMSDDQLRNIRQVAEMRFAQTFAPTVFDGYLQPKDQDEDPLKGSLFDLFAPNKAPTEEVVLARLPAADDEMLARVQRIRGRDYLLIDTLDGQYENLYRTRIGEYTNWRESRLNEINMVREIDRKANEEMGKGIAIFVLTAAMGVAASNSSNNSPSGNSIGGSIVGAGTSIAIHKMVEAQEIREQTGLNLEAMIEAGESFGASVEPVVLEVEGQTVELTGTAEAKYQQWRQVMQRLHAREVGLEPAAAISE